MKSYENRNDLREIFFQLINSKLSTSNQQLHKDSTVHSYFTLSTVMEYFLHGGIVTFTQLT